MITSTLLTVMSGSLIMGAVVGFMGVFPFLRHQSLLGDALSHAMLPGIATAFLISHTSYAPFLLIGAVGAGILTSFLFTQLQRVTPLKSDALLGLLLSSFFGLGLILMTVIQKKEYLQPAVIHRFFFGNASTMLKSDGLMIGLIGVSMVALILCAWKEIHVCLFDPSYATTIGYPVPVIERFLTFTFVIALALGLSFAGVILMSSFLIAPAVAARQWVKSVKGLCYTAACIGACAGAGGAFMSSYYVVIPTGPMIVVILSVSVFFSLVCSPTRGLIRYWCI